MVNLNYFLITGGWTDVEYGGATHAGWGVLGGEHEAF